jgi:hypothetical protein
MYINVNICLDTVQTRLYMFTTTVTLHFPSSPISLATPAASLSSAQEQLLLSSCLLGTSLFNWQTTQALLDTSKLPQPQVHQGLIHIAALSILLCRSELISLKSNAGSCSIAITFLSCSWVHLGKTWLQISTTLACTCMYNVHSCMWFVHTCLKHVYTRYIQWICNVHLPVLHCLPVQ